MPARSQAQAKLMGAKYSRGEISREELEDFNKGIKMKDLPKKVGKGKRKSGSKSRKGRGGRKVQK